MRVLATDRNLGGHLLEVLGEVEAIHFDKLTHEDVRPAGVFSEESLF
jgi:hypothetical protein